MGITEIPALIYPCWAYAFARIGRDFSLEHLEDYKKKLESFYLPLLGVGDFVVWRAKNVFDDFCPTMIDDTGQVLHRRVLYDMHVAVYEGDGLVSDCSCAESLPAHIRMRRLSDLPTPDKMLRWGESV